MQFIRVEQLSSALFQSRALAAGILCALFLNGCGHSAKHSDHGKSGTAQDGAKIALVKLEAAVDLLDQQMAGTYGTGIPVLTDGPLAHPADVEWPAPVGAMLVTERTLLDFAKTEALAEKCGFATDYAVIIKEGAVRLALTELVGPGYRSKTETDTTRKAELQAAAHQIQRVGAADCAVQESRVKATSVLAMTIEPSPRLAPAAVDPANYHRQILRLAKLGEVAARCAMSDKSSVMLSDLERAIEETALQAGQDPASIVVWHKEGFALGEFAFSAWPSVSCEIYRRALTKNAASLAASTVALQLANND